MYFFIVIPTDEEVFLTMVSEFDQDSGKKTVILFFDKKISYFFLENEVEAFTMMPSGYNRGWENLTDYNIRPRLYQSIASLSNDQLIAIGP